MAVFDEAGPGDFEGDLSELCRQSAGIEIYAQRYREAMHTPSYSPETRFEAVGQALLLLRRQFGR